MIDRMSCLYDRKDQVPTVGSISQFPTWLLSRTPIILIVFHATNSARLCRNGWSPFYSGTHNGRQKYKNTLFVTEYGISVLYRMYDTIAFLNVRKSFLFIQISPRFGKYVSLKSTKRASFFLFVCFSSSLTVYIGALENIGEHRRVS